MDIPKEVHLYWSSYDTGGGYFILYENKRLEGYSNYTWLGMAPVDFGEVEFDEKALALKALNKALGEAQGKVNEIKEKIQELLCIGHDEVEHAKEQILGDENIFDRFDDDIPFQG